MKCFYLKNQSEDMFTMYEYFVDTDLNFNKVKVLRSQFICTNEKFLNFK